MTISKQIGWSQKANLLWDISKELDKTLKSICTGPPCFTTTTTTTTTPLVLINGNYYLANCVPCESGCLFGEINLYTEQACVDLITVGCHIYLDLEGTINATEGYYPSWDGSSAFLYIDANGLVLNVDVCPQP
jgi:hypothetical protein